MVRVAYKPFIQTEPYKLFASNAKAHSRIIWQSTWTSDNLFFATGSRDKTIKIWEPLADAVSERLVIKFEEAVTACDFAPTSEDRVYRLAVGLETGEVQIIYIHAMENEMLLKDRISYPQSYFFDCLPNTIESLIRKQSNLSSGDRDLKCQHLN